MEPDLHVVHHGWVAESKGIKVVAGCGQEALLRLNVELARRELPSWQSGRLIVEEASFRHST